MNVLPVLSPSRAGSAGQKAEFVSQYLTQVPLERARSESQFAMGFEVVADIGDSRRDTQTFVGISLGERDDLFHYTYDCGQGLEHSGGRA
jgi:hypothetical protein